MVDELESPPSALEIPLILLTPKFYFLVSDNYLYLKYTLILINRKRVAFLTINKRLTNFCLNPRKKIHSGRRLRRRVCGENNIRMDYVKDEESIRFTHAKNTKGQLALTRQ